MANRYFTEQIGEGRAVLEGPDARHLRRVLRAKPGDALLLCDGQGFDYRVVIEEIDENKIECKIIEKNSSLGEADIRVEVYIGFAKGERMDYAVQKSVELGAASIRPFFSENTIVKPKKNSDKLTRFTRIAQEAAKQCGRGILPEVKEPADFSGMLERALQNELVLFMYEEGGASLRQMMAGKKFKTIGIVTGPEGGFSEKETRLAEERGCTLIGLGPRILRCETAPAAVLAALMTLTGNLE